MYLTTIWDFHSVWYRDDLVHLRAKSAIVWLDLIKMYIWLHNILNIILCFGFSNRVKFLKCDANMKFDKNLSSSEDKETKRALIRLYYCYLESYSWDAFSEEYFEQYKKHYTYTSNTGQLLTLKPNGTVYTKTGGDNFVNLSCGFPFNPKFGNTSRIPISECLWTRTIQFESGKNFSEKFFCKVSMTM